MSTHLPSPEPEPPAATGTAPGAESGTGTRIPGAPPEPAAGRPGEHQLVVPSTRTSSTWTGIGIGLFVLLLVIVFIAQNLKQTEIHFVGLKASVPVGLAVLLAFVLGGIFVLLLGVARLAQLRLVARRHRRKGAD